MLSFGEDVVKQDGQKLAERCGGELEQLAEHALAVDGVAVSNSIHSNNVLHTKRYSCTKQNFTSLVFTVFLHIFRF